MYLEFLTGSAGSGKTYEINRRLQAPLNSNNGNRAYGVVCATTGIAAVNLGPGVTTLNAELGYFDTDSLKDSYAEGRLYQSLKKVASKGENLIIDEVSMLPDEQLSIICDGLEYVNNLKEVEDRGGLGLILTGDMCLGKGTLVMMADGSLKKVEEIQITDKIMGVDSTPRNIIALISGIAPLYKVKQTNGDDYIVSEHHSLVLKRSIDGQRRERKGDWSNIRYANFLDKFCIGAPQLKSKSRKFRECFVGYKAGVINLPDRPILVDPYFLGLWLGDGDSDTCRITSYDIEVLEYCQNLATTLQIYCTKGKRGRISLTKIDGFNPLWDNIKKYDLPKNKHIPKDYLLNSEVKRLQLLAGLLDSDGNWSGNRYRITSTKELLGKQIKQLADGLGFRTSIKPLTSGPYKNGNNGGAWRVTIGGDTWRIPCKIKYKSSNERELVKNRLTSVLTIESIGMGEYSGFEIDGDHLFLLGDGTVTHNCQLPPIKAEFCFKSKWWGENGQPGKIANNITRLTKIWRQNNLKYIEALNYARRGEGDTTTDILANIPNIQWNSIVNTHFDGTTIVSRNDKVDRFNQIRLDELIRGGKRLVEFRNSRWGKQRSEWKLIPEVLEVCETAYVMILSNDPGEFTFANGDCGEIKEFVIDGGSKVYVTLRRNGETVCIKMITRRNMSKTHPDKIDPPKIKSKKEFEESLANNNEVTNLEGELLYKYGNIDQEYKLYLRNETAKAKIPGIPYYDFLEKKWCLGEVRYMPLRLAYASTVHKSQGLSLDSVQIDYNDAFFSQPAMSYVALSRCRTPEGLTIAGDRKLVELRTNVDSEVLSWI